MNPAFAHVEGFSDSFDLFEVVEQMFLTNDCSVVVFVYRFVACVRASCFC